jgi:uncharacterized protein (DUF58 family)
VSTENTHSAASAAFLNPEHLTPIRNLSVRARIIVEGLIAGLHQSPYHGFSAEFKEYRPYRTGEDVRRIDWRAFGRSDRAMIRLFADETNLYSRIFFDKSASMAFSAGGRQSKFDYARTLAASLAWILIRQRDAVGLITFDNAVNTVLPPRSTNTALKNILSALSIAVPGKPTACGTAIDAGAATVRRRGLSIVISDFLDDPAAIIRGLRHLRFKRQDVMIIKVYDPQEVNMTLHGPLAIRDLESGIEIHITGSVAADWHDKGFSSHQAILDDACRELGIDSSVVTTDEPFARALMRILEKRRQLL